MDKEVALELLQRFLEKRGVELGCIKQLVGLVATGKLKGFFKTPDSLFEEKEWRDFGDVLWDMVIDDDKIGKKLMKPWREVINCIKRYKVEKNLAAVVTQKLEKVEPSAPPPEAGCSLFSSGTTAPPGDNALLFSTSKVPEPPCWEKVKVTMEGSSNNQEAEEEKELGIGRKVEQQGMEQGKGEQGNKETGKDSGTCRRPMGINWRKVADEASEAGEFLPLAFPVAFEEDAHGDYHGNHAPLGWKLLSQLRNTVNESGLHGEPSKQMLNYIWGGAVLCPEDIKVIMRMIMTQSQLLLWQAHWQRYCEASAQTPREQGDPLRGVTVEQLMGAGPFVTIRAQLQMGPQRCLEAMRTARAALEHVKTAQPSPSYMGIKQGREETFARFIDRLTSAIEQSDVPEWMRAALLRQCVIQNSNTQTRNIISSLPADATVELMLDRMSRVPVGPQAMLVEAMKQLGSDILQAQQQAFTAQQQFQQQVFAALQPLRVNAAEARPKPPRSFKCYRCGREGHMRRNCQATRVWCENCRTNNHNTEICLKSGNGRMSASSRRAPTQVAAPAVQQEAPSLPTPTTTSATSCNQQQPAASGWIWQRQ
ncbi:uncharacterized protein LOC142364530 [Opisthocomus hoazin]|uniref:uncharacterized protein LOC142364530 n=1 Tax=Opisthocomus hoazin TaxID=30419 RepID=UPI003F5314C4